MKAELLYIVIFANLNLINANPQLVKSSQTANINRKFLYYTN